MNVLRPYQLDAIARTQAAYRAGARAVLLQMPTGAGKTHAAARGIIAPTVARGRRVVFAAHLEEIIDDTAGRLAAMGLAVGIIKSGRPVDARASVQVCSTPTLARLLERGEELPSADRVILDEAHRAASTTNRGVLGWYRERGALVCGLTATPSRGDGQPLNEFDALVTGPSVKELITSGALVRAQVFAPDRVLERGVACDPVELVLSELMVRRVVIFAPDGASAQSIHEQLCAGGYVTETVLDGTPSEVRRGVRARISSGATRGIVTVRAVVEGFDAPALDCAILCGAFTTVAPFLQAIGRVVRSHPGKTDALVYDLRGAVYLHGLPEDDRAWSLEGAQGRSTTERPAGLRRCGSCHAIFPPCTRCPRCGAVNVTDPRPMRVQRAELAAMGDLTTREMAERSIKSAVDVLVRRGMPAHRAEYAARQGAAAWVKTALNITVRPKASKASKTRKAGASDAA